MQVTVSLRNLSNLAYRVKNLQVTAFIQDPLDHTKLTPVATLLPDPAEPDDGFTLGPLVTNRGPFIFSNTTIVPALVESLMANPTGLIFRISNYDIMTIRPQLRLHQPGSRRAHLRSWSSTSAGPAAC